jgi:hypothetical protein
MKFDGRLILERKVQIPHQQHHQASSKRHAEEQTHTLRSSPPCSESKIIHSAILIAVSHAQLKRNAQQEYTHAAKQLARLLGS